MDTLAQVAGDRTTHLQGNTMTAVLTFKLMLLSLIAIIGLELVARHLRLPPAAALLAGGAAMAFVPDLPRVELDPELVLIVFLPPLLMDGAYVTVWDDFRCNLKGILLLAIGAVVFTTLVVGCVVHWLSPGLPWGACFALGAIVSPPDAIAAKAVLDRVALPRSVMVLLEGESLLNDAVGLVLYRFAVAAALTGAFSFQHAMGSFTLLSLGGVMMGGVIGYAVVKLVKYLEDTYLVIVATALAAWICYVVGEALDVSGVMATVTYGTMLGWHQHEIVSAAVRIRGTAFWQIVVFLFESLVFILIGLSLRDVVGRIGGCRRSAGDVRACSRSDRCSRGALALPMDIRCRRTGVRLAAPPGTWPPAARLARGDSEELGGHARRGDPCRRLGAAGFHARARPDPGGIVRRHCLHGTGPGRDHRSAHQATEARYARGARRAVPDRAASDSKRRSSPRSARLPTTPTASSCIPGCSNNMGTAQR